MVHDAYVWASKEPDARSFNTRPMTLDAALAYALELTVAGRRLVRVSRAGCHPSNFLTDDVIVEMRGSWSTRPHEPC